MNRKDIYNPILRYLKEQAQSNSSTISNKSLSIASSKQDFFKLKKKTSRCFNNNMKQKKLPNDCSILVSKLQNNNNTIMNKKNSYCVIENQIDFDDDMKTTSTKSYQTYQDNKIDKTLSKNTNIKQFKQYNYKSKTVEILSDPEIENNTEITQKNQNQIFKSQYYQNNTNNHYKKYHQIHKQISQFNSKPQFNKHKHTYSQTFQLTFRTNQKKKTYSPKISHFLFSKQPIGQGTYSKVFKALHKITGMLCAIKVFHKDKILKLNLLPNLIDQIKIMTLGQHPNINKLWGFFQQGQYFYLILEYCTQGELYNLIKNFQQKDKLNPNLYIKKIYYIQQLCKAIQFLHENNVMHRDIKPQNILITINDNIKLIDFGWAKIIKNQKQQLRRTLCGTPLYLAPEQIQHHHYNKSVDLWAIGILSFELLTGRIPFQIQSFSDLNKIVHQEINYKSIQCFPLVKQFISILLQKDKQKRVEASKLSQHPVFSILQQFNQNKFILQLEFGKII